MEVNVLQGEKRVCPDWLTVPQHRSCVCLSLLPIVDVERSRLALAIQVCFKQVCVLGLLRM